MTTTVFTIFNDYLGKLSEWKAEAISIASQKKWDHAKTTIALRIISSVEQSDLGFEDGKLQANMDIFFAFSECNMYGRTIQDLEEYIGSICKEYNEFCRIHFRFKGCISSNTTGGTMRIGWEF